MFARSQPNNIMLNVHVKKGVNFIPKHRRQPLLCILCPFKYFSLCVFFFGFNFNVSLFPEKKKTEFIRIYWRFGFGLIFSVHSFSFISSHTRNKHKTRLTIIRARFADSIVRRYMHHVCVLRECVDVMCRERQRKSKRKKELCNKRKM